MYVHPIVLQVNVPPGPLIVTPPVFGGRPEVRPHAGSIYVETEQGVGWREK